MVLHFGDISSDTRWLGAANRPPADPSAQRARAGGPESCSVRTRAKLYDHGSRPKVKPRIELVRVRVTSVDHHRIGCFPAASIYRRRKGDYEMMDGGVYQTLPAIPNFAMASS